MRVNHHPYTFLILWINMAQQGGQEEKEKTTALKGE